MKKILHIGITSLISVIVTLVACVLHFEGDWEFGAAFWDSFWFNSVVSGLVVSILASAIFFALLSLMKPNLKLSEVVAMNSRKEKVYEMDMEESEKAQLSDWDWEVERGMRFIRKERTRYQLKVINKTPYDIFDVQYRLKFVVPTFGPEAKSTLKVALVTLAPQSLAPTIPRYSKRDTNSEYCIQLATYSPLEAYWREKIADNEDTSPYLQLAVVARHGFSGFPKIFRQRILDVDCIQPGRFIPGDTFRLKKEGQTKAE